MLHADIMGKEKKVIERKMKAKIFSEKEEKSINIYFASK